MENPKKVKLPVIITGVLFAVSLILLCVLIVLQLSGGEAKKENESSNSSVSNESSSEKPTFQKGTETDERQSETATIIETGAPGNADKDKNPEDADETGTKGRDDESGNPESGKQLQPANPDDDRLDGGKAGISPGEISTSGELSELEAELTELVGGYDGTWSIYIKDLNTDATVCINNRKMQSASLIKLYIMAAVYDWIEDERLTPDQKVSTENYGEQTVKELLNMMITVSDNPAANELVKLLSDDNSAEGGMEVVNAWIKLKGYNLTIQERELFGGTVNNGENYTSVEDCGRFLESIYKGTCVSEDASEAMELLLRNQTLDEKIPAGLPQGRGVHWGNKTGELTGVENDAAIIYGEDGKDYILCIMTENQTDTSVTRTNIVNISKSVYEYIISLSDTDDATHKESDKGNGNSIGVAGAN